MLKNVGRITAILFVLILVTAQAAEARRSRGQAKIYPRGCSPAHINYEFDYLLLGTTQSDSAHRVFVFKNISHNPILVEQAPEQNSLGTHFNSVIEPNKWSALLVEQPNFKLLCHDAMGRESWAIACHQVLRACELRVAPIMESAQGQYWIAENINSQRTLFGELRGHGIFP